MLALVVMTSGLQTIPLRALLRSIAARSTWNVGHLHVSAARSAEWSISLLRSVIHCWLTPDTGCLSRMDQNHWLEANTTSGLSLSHYPQVYYKRGESPPLEPYKQQLATIRWVWPLT